MLCTCVNQGGRGLIARNNSAEKIEPQAECADGIHDAFTAELKTIDEVQTFYRPESYQCRDTANESIKVTRTAQLTHVTLNNHVQIDFPHFLGSFCD
jgi:hypothetical protein